MAKNYDFSALSILVVEDNDLMASLLCSILSALRVNRVVEGATEVHRDVVARTLAVSSR